VPLLQKTLTHIEENQELRVQTSWRCATGMCFAGTADDLAGGQWYDVGEYRNTAWLWAEPDDDPTMVIESNHGHRIVHAADRARRLLNLTVSNADWLFDGNNTLAGLEFKVGYLADQAARLEREAAG